MTEPADHRTEACEWLATAQCEWRDGDLPGGQTAALIGIGHALLANKARENCARRARAEAFAEAADHLDKIADLTDGPNSDVIELALRPAALAFRTRAARELAATEASRVDRG